MNFIYTTLRKAIGAPENHAICAGEELCVASLVHVLVARIFAPPVKYNFLVFEFEVSRKIKFYIRIIYYRILFYFLFYPLLIQTLSWCVKPKQMIHWCSCCCVLLIPNNNITNHTRSQLKRQKKIIIIIIITIMIHYILRLIFIIISCASSNSFLSSISFTLWS